VDGLTPSTNYCFTAVVVENATGTESALSATACATTYATPVNQGWSFNRSTICSSVSPVSPWDPINETIDYTYGDTQICSWIQLDNVSGTHNVTWQWYDPDSNLVREDSAFIDDPTTHGYPLPNYYRLWICLDIAGRNLFGMWQIYIKVDGVDAGFNAANYTVTLGQPTNLLTSNVTSTSVNLNWTAATNAALYRIYRNSELIHETTQPSFADSGLNAVTTYAYQVKAVNGNRESAFSNQVIIVTPYATPAMVTDLAVGNATASSLSLSWTATANASKYQIYRNVVLVGETTQTGFVDNGLTAQTSYTYYAVSVNGDLSSSPSTSVIGTTIRIMPMTPMNVSVTVQPI